MALFRLSIPVVLATLAALLATRPPSEPDAPAPVRGMTISCPTWGWEWGTDEMVESMRLLRDLGVNWIAIHPYAGIREDGTVVMSDRSYGEGNTDWLTRPIAEAHALGLEIMIKPHIAYWGSGFSWRGEIRFRTDEQWERFFETYEAWISTVARLARDADAFSVGTELGGTVHHETRWRRIISAVREETDAHLTYSANWDRFEDVEFWDDLDAIGIQSYFPLVEHDRLPTTEELERAWRSLIDRLEGYGRRLGKPVVLAELGYARSPQAARRPWEYREGGANADETQQRCLRAALAALRDSDVVVGCFLWKWFPGERSRSNFIKSTPEMRAVIRESWAASP